MRMIVSGNRAFTLIELIMVIVIIGILASVAAQKFGSIAENVQVEETLQEMDMLATAIAGDPRLENNGVRSDFGYVGDVGALPPNLDALVTNPGGFATWKGPYIKNSFEQISDDYKKDAWQTEYTYAAGPAITSTGSGETITRRLAASTNELVRNRVTGNIFDLDGTPPGNDYHDSLTVRLTLPNGAGGLTTKSAVPDIGGYFAFDSVPIGNHRIELIYQPNHDTLRQFVSVEPRAALYSEYRLTGDVWRGLNLNTGLIGYWPLNELSGMTTADVSGNGNDGTLTNMTGAEWTTGKIGGALTFDGIDDEIIIPDDDALDGVNRLTISFWIYPTVVDGNPRGPISKRVQYTSEYSYGVFPYGGNHINVDIDGNNNRFACPATLQANHWYHVAVVFDGTVPAAGRVSVYLNGVLDCTRYEASASIPNTNSNLVIGHLFGNSSGFFAGTIDDVRLYGIALSESEIQALYGMGN